MEKRTIAGFLQLFSITFMQLSTINALEIKATVRNKTFIGEASYKSNDKGYAKFFGIRYGQPPVGDQRFQKTSIYTYKEDVVEAKKHGDICPQNREGNSLISNGDSMSEDCLFLNIIVPLDYDQQAPTVQDVSKLVKKKAVYIFIHGGVFVVGSSNLFVTTDFAIKGDIIAVTLNYRLGVLGFLTTDDDVMPANLGLWDQQLAIQWVKQNIEAFGGDSSRITLGGHSAGSMSAVLQSFYPGNNDLFQNVIAQSGSPISTKAVSEKGLPTATEVANIAGCGLASTKDDELSKEIIKCLKAKTAMDLANMKNPQRLLGPVLDNDFITKETFELFRGFSIPDTISLSFANKNFLTGFTTDDGEIVVSLALKKLAESLMIINKKVFLAKPTSSGLLQILIEKYILTTTNGDPILTQTLVDAIMEYYTVGFDSSNLTSVSMSAVNIFTDVYFAKPTLNTALHHSIANTCGRLNMSNCGNMTRKTYLYEFRLPRSNPLAITGDFPWFQGTRHGAELFFFSDYPIKDNAPDLAETVLEAWINFIRTGNPNSASPNEWKEFTEKFQWMYLLTDKSKTVRGTLAKRIHFWDKYIPKLQDQLQSALDKGKTMPNIKTKCRALVDNNGGLKVKMGKQAIFITALIGISSTVLNYRCV